MKDAKIAILLTCIALCVSTLLSIVAIIVQFYTSKSTEIDSFQFQEIKNLISAEVKK